MATYFIQGETLTGIANAIRSKTGIGGEIKPTEMASKINQISGEGGVVPNKIAIDILDQSFGRGSQVNFVYLDADTFSEDWMSFQDAGGSLTVPEYSIIKIIPPDDNDFEIWSSGNIEQIGDWAYQVTGWGELTLYAPEFPEDPYPELGPLYLSWENNLFQMDVHEVSREATWQNLYDGHGEVTFTHIEGPNSDANVTLNHSQYKGEDIVNVYMQCRSYAVDGADGWYGSIPLIDPRDDTRYVTWDDYLAPSATYVASGEPL